MRIKTLNRIIAIMWIVLILRAVFASNNHKSTRDTGFHYGYAGHCFESILAAELMHSIFWGIFATVLLVLVYDGVATLFNVHMIDNEE